MSADKPAGAGTTWLACISVAVATAALVIGGYSAHRPIPKPAPVIVPPPLPAMGVCVDPVPYETTGMVAVQSISAPVLSPGGVLMCQVGTFVPVRPA